MRSIIITGRQGTGKTQLARLIASGKNDLEISSLSDIKYITNETNVIIFDEIDNKKNLQSFKDLASRKTLTFRPPYSRKEVTIDCDEMLLIGISQSPIIDSRHSFVYNLS